ncbi:F-box only protein 36b [Epinephelus fuscoguttatus]|uniref:F-box only protein 36b n=1 Tax=Epinephelus fuscoguttatus TaxID=293821 RepID=UPI0020D03F08|nr:F-box only protein 36b [Epinephelus fuscoguttatus]
MASLLKDPLFEISGNAPPPNRNYYHFVITKSAVIWRWWKISPRAVDRNSRPGEVKESHQDLLDDAWLQSEISMVFGRGILQYTKALCQGHYDYLERLSDSILLRIINYLELEDVGQLGRTSRRFRQLCGSQEFWEQAVRQRCCTVSAEEASLALEVGWRSMFFTSRLQLQKLISRRRLKTKEQQERQVSEPCAKIEVSPDESSETDQTSGSEEESHHGIIPHLSLGTDPVAGFDTSSSCDVDPDPNPEPQAGTDSSVLVPCQVIKGRKKCAVASPVQNDAVGSGRGDFFAEPDKTLN